MDRTIVAVVRRESVEAARESIMVLYNQLFFGWSSSGRRRRY